MHSTLTLILGFTAAIANVANAAGPPRLDLRQTRWAIQNWKNDFADVNFTSGAAGQFSAEWDNSFAGNFVVGKGYRPGGDMSVHLLPRIVNIF